MAQEQVGNASVEEAPESDYQALDDIESGAFFESLDTSVNSGIIDSEYSQSTSQDLGDNTPASPSGVQEQGEDALQKRYSDSSREAKRLNGKLNELEPYMPILDAMREDPNLIQHVRNYFEGGGQAPQTMTEKLQLSEDFMFDADDAFGKPDSDSARVLGATVDGIVQQRLGQALKGQKAENQRLTKETTFRNKHEMSDEEWNDFVSYAKGKSLELDDIYYLKNRQNRDTKIADDARNKVATQMKKAQDQPRSLATAGSVPVETSQDDSVFDAIVGLDSELESAFG